MNYPTHLVTQVDRPGSPAGGVARQRPDDTTSQLEQENVDQCPSWCCWLGGLCGSGSQSRSQQKQAGARTELTQANQSAAGYRNQDQGGSRHQSSNRDGAGGAQQGGAYGNNLITPVDQGQNREPSPSASPTLSHSAIPGLLGPKKKAHKGKKCLVLDLDETLVHSSFKPVHNADFIVPVEIDGVVYKVYVLKRPYVDLFLTECAKYYEVVIFTASLGKYANPLLDMLDTSNVIEHRLFRESCVLHGQAYVKDLSKLGRRMEDVIFVDNSPLSYAFHPTSAVPILSWFDDPHDTQLQDLLPVLKTTLRDATDVREILDANNKSYEWLCAQGKDY